MTRDISIVVAVTTNPDSTIIEINVREGDESMRADVTELIKFHLAQLWSRLELANRTKAVNHISLMENKG